MGTTMLKNLFGVIKMSLDKSILHNKEKRQNYRGAKLYCKQCRNHGSCDYCKNNRQYRNTKRLKSFEDRFNEAYEKE